MNGSTYEYMGNTMVPLRGIAEALGYAVQWNSELKAVEISNNDVKVDFNTGVNSYSITKNKDLKACTPISLATAPVIKDGQHMFLLNFSECSTHSSMTLLLRIIQL